MAKTDQELDREERLSIWREGGFGWCCDLGISLQDRFGETGKIESWSIS